jgi:hypothetical protein
VPAITKLLKAVPDDFEVGPGASAAQLNPVRH